MTEKFITTTKLCWKKCRKVVYTLIVLTIVVGGSSAWVHYATHVGGYITAMNGSQITVSNKLFDRTVDISSATLNGKTAKIGDRISVEKNLSGQIITARLGDQKLEKRGNNKMQPAKNGKGMNKNCPATQPAPDQPNSQPVKTN
ncbi:MAG: hypothetical protein WCP79_13280 [Bacillota bacterium]